MSNRGDFVGTAPNSGNYIPSPVPSEQEDLPVYVNDELLRMGGTLNGILEGGALPPHSELPKRFREGMIMNFSQAINDEIYSSGIWLYKKGKWWKLIDDPTEIGVNKFIYRLTTDDTPPATPAPSVGIPQDWSENPPRKGSKTDWIWVSSSIDFDQKTKEHTWSDPVAWSAGVADGAQGESFETWFANSPYRPATPDGYPPIGSDGITWTKTPPSEEGAIIWAVTALVDISNPNGTVWTFPVRWNGSSGTEGQRGFLGINVPGTAWSDEVAWDAIVAETVGLTPNRPIPWDNVTIFDNDTSFAVTKRYVRGNKPGVWDEVAHVIDGDMIVRGTLAGDALVANAITTDKLAAGAVSADKIAANAITGVKIDSATTIRAGTGNQSASLDGANSTWRLYAGSSTPANAPFRVDKDGNVYATSGTFGGKVYAQKVDGDFTAVAIKKIPDGYATFTGGVAGMVTPKELFKIQVSDTKPYDRYIKIDPISFDFNQNGDWSAYHMMATGIGLNPAGVPEGPEEQLIGPYDAWWWQPSIGTRNESNYSPAITVKIPANVRYRVTVSIGVEASSKGGKLWQQDLVCTLFKQGTELSFV